jgi:hypothetical protein
MRVAHRGHQTPAVAREAALSRACVVWQCEANVFRSDVRERGVRGPLRVFDEAASGQRGKAAPKGLAMWARELYAAGATQEEVADRLAQTARLIARAAYDGPNPAA